MQAPHGPRYNRLLATLPLAEYQRLEKELAPVALALGDVLYESGCAQHHVYFPTTAIVSMLYVLADGASAEIAVVGNEGLLGIAPSRVARAPPAARWCKAPAGATA